MINVSSWSIRNPIPAVMLFVLLCFAGLLSFNAMKVQQFPDIELPTVSVSASLPGAAPVAEPFVHVEDCEKVTRQLQFVLEVEGCTYERLEVSSPGLNRPLKRAADYARFVGEEGEIALRMPFQGRQKYKGLPSAQPEQTAGDAWRIVFDDGTAEQALDFSLEEVREARLVPVVNFKGRGVKPGPAKKADKVAQDTEDAVSVDDKQDGGSDQ